MIDDVDVKDRESTTFMANHTDMLLLLPPLRSLFTCFPVVLMTRDP